MVRVNPLLYVIFFLPTVVFTCVTQQLKREVDNRTFAHQPLFSSTPRPPHPTKNVNEFIYLPHSGETGGQGRGKSNRSPYIVSKCLWNLNDLPRNPPLYVNPDSPYNNTLDFYPPDEYDRITIYTGKRLRFSCPGTEISGMPGKSELTVLCFHQFHYFPEPGVQGPVYRFHTVYCNEPVKSEIQFARHDPHCNSLPINTGRSNHDLTYHTVGFPSRNKFFAMYDFCYDHTKSDIVYANYTLSKAVIGNQLIFKQPKLRSHPVFYPINPEILYKKEQQMKTFTEILGDVEIAKNISLFDSQLVKKENFQYLLQKNTTFWYMNIVPQFQNENWQILHEKLHAFVIKKKRNYHVFTGVSGKLQWENENGEFVDLYLYKKDNEMRITVPELLWLVLFEYDFKKGVAFLLFNTGDQVRTLDQFDCLCDQVCDEISIEWEERVNLTQGLGTCCRINDKLFENVPEIPRFLNQDNLLRD